MNVKLCKDCRHYLKLKIEADSFENLKALYSGLMFHQCHAVKSLVDGRSQVSDAERMRDRNAIECGPEAKLFEPLDHEKS
jgi:hypothetical protein